MKIKYRVLLLSLIAILCVFMATGCGSESNDSDKQAAEAEKPTIGISWMEDTESDEPSEDLQAYIDSIEKAEAEPILLPLVENKEEAAAELEKVDALVMTGGEDIDPKYYDEEADAKLEEVNDARDVSDMALMEVAIEKDFPTLCTCRGLQVLNVVQGGTLIQDIPTQFDSDIQHRDPELVDFVYHDIALEDGSIISSLMEKETINVNSWHHQGIKDLGSDLKVTAKSEDGMIEAVEINGSENIVAVQFHPEWHIVEGDDSFLIFFTNLIKDKAA